MKNESDVTVARNKKSGEMMTLGEVSLPVLDLYTRIHNCYLTIWTVEMKRWSTGMRIKILNPQLGQDEFRNLYQQTIIKNRLTQDMVS